MSETVNALPADGRCLVEIEAQRRGRRAIAQQPSPGGTGAKIEERVRAFDPDLLGEDRRIGGTDPASDD
jgi:hypothetical protein